MRTLAAPPSPSRALKKVGLALPAEFVSPARRGPAAYDPKANRAAALAAKVERQAADRRNSWQPGQWHASHRWVDRAAPPRVAAAANVLFNNDVVFSAKPSEADRAALRGDVENHARYSAPRPPNLATAGPPGTSHRMLARPPRAGTAPTKRRILAVQAPLMVGGA